MLDLRHISLAALLIFTTGMTGCKNKLVTPIEIDKKKTARNVIVAYVTGSSKTAPIVANYTDIGIEEVNATNLAVVNAQIKTLTSLTTDNSLTTDEVAAKIQEVVDSVMDAYTILSNIGNQHSSHKSTITVAQLKDILPALENINDKYESNYQKYIASAESSFSLPATKEEVQSMIDAVNASEAALKHIAQEDNSTSSTITVEELRAIFPALNIDENKIKEYQNYIISTNNDFSSPAATVKEVQRMIVTVNLHEFGSYDTEGSSMSVTLSSDGTKAYVADGDKGLVIVDINDPAHPIKIGSYNTAGDCTGYRSIK